MSDELLRQVEADADQTMRDVLGELREDDIRLVRAGQVAPGLVHILAAMDEGSVVRHGGKWVAGIDYSADMLREAGMAYPTVDGDGVERLRLTGAGLRALTDAEAPQAADVEAQRAAVEPQIRRYERQQRRRKAFGRAARRGVLVAALLTLGWLIADAIR
ncbi:hypothetical protein [Micromonospora profundi]|uniref:hypothetical protein n=1 Tax=Micromonospora profundi TaxID=1420889 RepID=UPI00365E1A12